MSIKKPRTASGLNLSHTNNEYGVDMNLKQCQEIADKISKNFGISSPAIVDCRRKNNAVYDPKSSLIFINISSFSTKYQEYSLIHEVAHHISWILQRETRHNIVYYSTLIEVIRFNYDGCLDLYPWNKEYKRLRIYYSKYHDNANLIKYFINGG